jgi:hypothetical protein
MATAPPTPPTPPTRWIVLKSCARSESTKNAGHIGQFVLLWIVDWQLTKILTPNPCRSTAERDRTRKDPIEIGPIVRSNRIPIGFVPSPTI